jgi:signal transduction histidine kinase
LPLLRDLLAATAENRRLSEAPIIHNLEADADHLHEALQRQYVTEDRRLRASKLNALAELAAGAGHEINNPLAVISGQAQYLLHHEPEPARHRALQTIIAQAHRIHLILSELMQFARPPRPQKQWIDAANVTDHVAGQLQELANERQVQVERFSPGQAVPVYADERQLETALRCLMRNGIEAAPPGGWVRVHLKMATAEQVEWIVEDSGPGPLPNHREHLFDPFYSGRQAGRGLGLGLPTAWRLATQHGGDVRFEQAPLGPTRFVMVIPQKADADQPDSCQEAPGPKPENGQSANGSGHGTGEDGTMSLAPGPHGTDSAPATN